MTIKSFKRALDVPARTRLKTWVRERFALGADDAVLVAEVACGQPGCPPLETVVAFWTAPERRHNFRIFKPVEDILEDDLPPSWMKDALVGNDALDCC